MMNTTNIENSNQHDTGTHTACPRELHCYVLEIGNYYDSPDITRIFADGQTAKANIPKGFNEWPNVTTHYYYGHDDSRGKWASIKKYEIE